MRPINNLVNNLVYCTSAAGDIDTVIVDGRPLVRAGRLLSWDEGKVVTEAEAYTRQRFAKAGLNWSPFYN